MRQEINCSLSLYKGKEMGFTECEGEKERVKGKNKKVTGSKINRSLPDFIGITTKL